MRKREQLYACEFVRTRVHQRPTQNEDTLISEDRGCGAEEEEEEREFTVRTAGRYG